MMELSPSETLLFALLRISLQGRLTDRAPFEGIAASVWKECRSLAGQQGVTALSYDGVMLLPPDLQPPKEVKISWAISTEACEDAFHRRCAISARLSEFFASHGIATVQLKGAALSPYYSKPEHRQGGDIDIYTFSSDPEKMSDAEANRLADELIRQQGISVDTEVNDKHSVFSYEGVSVENHKTFLDTTVYPLAARTDKLLLKLFDPQEISPDGEHRIMAPSVAFNTVFLPFHAAQHYCGAISLHHAFDWACLVKKHGLHLPKEITDRRFLRFVYALTWICDNYLGTSVNVQDSKEVREEVGIMLGQMLRPPYRGLAPMNGKAAMVLYKLKRRAYRRKISKRVFRRSTSKPLLRSILRHLRQPKRIFTAT